MRADVDDEFKIKIKIKNQSRRAVRDVGIEILFGAQARDLLRRPTRPDRWRASNRQIDASVRQCQAALPMLGWGPWPRRLVRSSDDKRERTGFAAEDV